MTTPRKISERPSYRSNDFSMDTPKRGDPQYTDKYALNESKLGFYGLILSLAIITTKLYYLNRNYIHELIFQRELISLEQVTKDGGIVFRNVWKDSVRYSKYWLPILCGAITTYFTWVMVYLDSNVPGVQPPSPLSPSKYKIQSGHSFHLNYIFALLVGILVSVYMFWKEISL